MSDNSQDLARQAIATATRLRQIQSDFADDDVKTRQKHLADEVYRVLNSLIGDQQEAFLKALCEHFPTWDAHTVTEQSHEGLAATQSPTDQREWADYTFVLERLIELTPTLSNGQKAQVIDRLAAMGLAPVGDLSCPSALVDELRSVLQLDAPNSIEVTRVIEMAIRLVSFTNSLDQLVWRIWKNVAPRSRLRANGLQKTMRRFASNEADVPLTRDLEQMRHVVVSLLSAISQIGLQFGQQHLAKFAPHEIEAAAAIEPGGFLVGKEVKCWRKYVELAKTMDDPAAIDSQVKQIIADFVESMPGLLKRG